MTQTPHVPIGTIYLPSSGTHVGMFDFIVDPHTGLAVEIGTPVAADTTEGTVVGTVIDMRTVGVSTDPVRDDLGASYDTSYIATVPEVVVATVQVFSSPAMRPVRAGIVRAATAEELLDATGFNRIDWPIPAGVLGLADGSWAKVCMDGKSLLGPESAHLIVNGLSGQAAKTSYAGVLLRSAIAAGDQRRDSVAALIFNVKGQDLLWLDKPPVAGYELGEEDQMMYSALGIPAEPFEDVEVWAPTLPGGNETRSARTDARVLRWDLKTVWDYLKFLLPYINEDEKVSSFLAEFRDLCLRNPDPAKRIDTFDKLDAWFEDHISSAQENNETMGWRSHHVATMRRLRRMLVSLVARGGGLLARGSARPSDDIPVTGWGHGQVVVIDIAGLHTDVQALVIGRTIERLFKASEDGEGIGVDHLVVFADELNAFAPSQGGEMASVRKVLQKVSTQGRYAGISLWGACQKMSKIDELVRDNAASRAVGITADGELASGAYGRLPGGLTERLATLPKGQMALWHYTYRGALVVRFPRPAWQTGKAGTTGRAGGALGTLGVSERSKRRLTEGIDEALVEEIIARADDPEAAVEQLQRARVVDMRQSALHEPTGFDPEDPFDLG